MIYGAYGYTGQLIARQALARGHRPLLAGRDEAKLAPLARELDLPCVSVALEDRAALLGALGRVAAVCHAAGPFIHTCEPMLAACLEARVSYLDITGELPVIESVFERHTQAEQRGIALIPGVGFDVVPSDCLARFVAERVPDATELELALAVLGRPSGGTTKASFEGVLRGNFVRRAGKLEQIPFGQGLREVQFSDRKRSVLPIPWGDLATAFRSTGIADITTYLAVPAELARALPLARPLLPGLSRLLGLPLPRRLLLSLISSYVSGPSERARRAGSAYLWARAANRAGLEQQAWLETIDGYAFTAESAVLALEALERTPRRGALTPAQAFGTDFVLSVSGSVRHEQLPAQAHAGQSWSAAAPRGAEPG
jgi:short subunit dehydrogenase-like uncharacterized protein